MAKTMSVFLLSASLRSEFQVTPEEAVDLPEDRAKGLIEAGAARPAKKAKRTATRKPKAETATSAGHDTED